MRFFRRKSRSQQNMYDKSDHSFHHILSLKKPRSFYEGQLTQHCEKYTPITQPKALLREFSSKHVLDCSQKKNLHCTISRRPRIAFSKHLQRKCLDFLVYLRKEILFWRRRKLSFGGGLNNFLKTAHCLDLGKCFKVFHFNWILWKFNYFYTTLILLHR